MEHTGMAPGGCGRGGGAFAREEALELVASRAERPVGVATRAPALLLLHRRVPGLAQAEEQRPHLRAKGGVHAAARDATQDRVQAVAHATVAVRRGAPLPLAQGRSLRPRRTRAGRARADLADGESRGDHAEGGEAETETGGGDERRRRSPPRPPGPPTARRLAAPHRCGGVRDRTSRPRAGGAFTERDAARPRNLIGESRIESETFRFFTGM